MAEEDQEEKAAETPKPVRRVKRVLRDASPAPPTTEAPPPPPEGAPPVRKAPQRSVHKVAAPGAQPLAKPVRKPAPAKPVTEVAEAPEAPVPKAVAKKPVPKVPPPEPEEKPAPRPKPAKKEVPEPPPVEEAEVPEKEEAGEAKPEKRAKKVRKEPAKKARKVAKEEKEEKEEAEEGEEEEEHVARSKPELSDAVRKALRVRRLIASRRPTFYRQEWWRYPRLGLTWRKPQGGQSKLRRHYGYRINVVSVGYRGPKTARGLHPSGFEEVLVRNVRDMKSIDPKRQAARIGGTVGGRLREILYKEAEDRGVRVLNRREE